MVKLLPQLKYLPGSLETSGLNVVSSSGESICFVGVQIYVRFTAHTFKEEMKISMSILGI